MDKCQNEKCASDNAIATRVNSSAGHHRNELFGGIVASIVAPGGKRWTDGMFL